MRTLPLFLILAACGTETPAALDGAVYEMSAANLTVANADDGAADLVRNALPTLLLQAASADDSSVTWRLAIADGDPPVQDGCSRTLDLPKATLTDGAFEIASTDLQITTWTLADASSSGTISDDLGTISDITLFGTVDARELVGVVPLLSSAESICSAFGGFGLDCEACDDSEPMCIRLEQSGFSATAVDAQVDAIDVDPLCE